VTHDGRRYSVAEMAGRRISRVKVELVSDAEARTEDDGLEVSA
jgi:hypothetical protein